MKQINWFGQKVARSSLGYHMLAPYLYKELEQPIIEAKPACLKIVADRDEFSMFGNYYNNLQDKTIFVARAFTPCELVMQGISYGLSVDTIAGDWHNAILPLVHHLPKAYWEICNEPPAEFTPILAQVIVRCIELAYQNGFRVAAPCWSEGTPQMARWGGHEDWADFMPALQAIHYYGPGTVLLAVHEYARWGSPTNDFIQPWRLTRINGVYEDIIDPAGLNIWTIITEYGRDNPKWQEIALSAEVFAAELANDAVQDAYDARVVGRLIYTLDAHPDWQKTNIYGNCFNIVNQYIANHQPSVYPPIPQPGIPVPPVPPPPPPTGTKIVNVDGLFLREGPGMNYNKITIMPRGTVVDLLDRNGDWVCVLVDRDFWQLATSTDYATYSKWTKQPNTLLGWCYEAYLK